MARQTFTKSSEIGVTAQELFDWHMRPGALSRLSPPWQPVEVVGQASTPAVGDRVTLRLGAPPLRITWVAGHTEVVQGRGFEDIQIRGPFKGWRHRHSFEPLGEASCRLEDSIEYELPFGPLGRLAGPGVRRSLRRTFAYRHATTSADLEFHKRYRTAGKKKVAISGSTGLIGSALTAFLRTGGHDVVPLVRDRGQSDETATRWTPEKGIIETGALEGVDAVIHLEGAEAFAGRWSTKEGQQDREDRIRGVRRLLDSLRRLPRPPQIILGISSIGVYGDRGDEVVDESSSAGAGPLASTCRQWEEALSTEFESPTRAVVARLGVVLSPRGGVLARMLPAFRLGAGGRVGDGSQFTSWIGIDDVVGALTHLVLTPEARGPFNLVTPNPMRFREFADGLARVLSRPVWTPMPSGVARVVFGSSAEKLLSISTRASCDKLEASGYVFRTPELQSALSLLLGRP